MNKGPRRLLRRPRQWFSRSPRARAILSVGLLGLLVFALLQLALQSYAMRDAQRRQQALANFASDYGQSLQLRLTEGLAALTALESILALKNYDPGEFDDWGRLILHANRNLSAVELAPDGVVRHILPLEGNEKALGHDLLADGRRDAGARKAIDSRAVTFVGPVRLIQNGSKAVIARKPLFRPVADTDGEDETFWGFAIVVMTLDALLGHQPSWSEDASLAWRLRGDDPDQNEGGGRPLIAQSANANSQLTWDLTQEIAVPNGHWQLQLADVRPVAANFILWQVLIAFLTGTLSALFYERARQREKIATRLRYERNFALFSNTLVADRSNAIDHCLTYVLDAAQCSRVYVFQNFLDAEGRLVSRQTHEACAEGVCPQLDNPALQHLDYDADGFARWKHELSHDRVINGVVASFPDSERAVLGPQSILSILVIPIWMGKEWSGFVGYDETRQTKQWSADDLNLLRAVSQALGMYLDRKQAEASLKASEERFRLAFEHANDGVCILDLEGRILQTNDRMGAIFGHTRSELTRLSIAQLADEQDQQDSASFIAQGLAGGESSSVRESRYRHRDGRVIWARVSSSLVRDRHGQPLHFVVHVQDITRLKETLNALMESESRYRRLATIDDLTQINNRRHFIESVRREIGRFRRYRSTFALILFDVDHFKSVNDTHGHDVGDRVLVTIASRTVATLREVDICGRLGGEEFAVALPETGLEGAMIVAERLRAGIESTMIHLPGGDSLRVTASFGVAMPEDDAPDADALLKHADLAMYAAKKGGRNRVVRYLPEMGSVADS